MDANFRLKNRLRSNSKEDPGLGTGWAYFVPEEPYREHIMKFVSQEEVYSIYFVTLRQRSDIHPSIDQHLLRFRSLDKCKPEECEGASFYRCRCRDLRSPLFLEADGNGRPAERGTVSVLGSSRRV